MIDSVRIRNFRCFESAEISGLGRINVVVGDNRSGKTALLEAIYLVCGNSPQNHFKVREWRGYSEGLAAVSTLDIASGALWRDLFFQFKFSVLVNIELRGTPSRSLAISFDERPSVTIPTKGSDVRAPVKFTWTDAKGTASSSVPRFTEKEGLVLPVAPVGIPGAMMGPVGAREVARLFSALDKRNKAHPIVASLKLQFPEIESISMQSDPGVGALLYTQLRGMPEQLPLPFVSAGINRLLAMLIEIETYPKGVVLIDEIENGIYFRRLQQMWGAVAEASGRQGTQLFVSTHSEEALKALVPVMKGNEADFRLIRLSRDSEGRSQIRVVKGGDLEAAIEEGVEVR
jgi:hypothetical protein